MNKLNTEELKKEFEKKFVVVSYESDGSISVSIKPNSINEIWNFFEPHLQQKEVREMTELEKQIKIINDYLETTPDISLKLQVNKLISLLTEETSISTKVCGKNEEKATLFEILHRNLHALDMDLGLTEDRAEKISIFSIYERNIMKELLSHLSKQVDDTEILKEFIDYLEDPFITAEHKGEGCYSKFLSKHYEDFIAPRKQNAKREK